MRPLTRTFAAGLACVLGLTASSALTARPALARSAQSGSHGRPAALPVSYDFATAFAATLATPDVAPPGANDFSCRPSAAHPDPVILVHGTFENMDDNWQAASPVLVNHGYCVFAFNYGGLFTADPIQGTQSIVPSARRLAAFTGRVLAATGAAKVDIVGHSQGGMMPRYYLRFLGGAARVHTLVGLAPSNHGTTIDGLTTLAQTLSLLGGFSKVLGIACPACRQQEPGSAFLTRLNAGGDTVPGVNYTVIESKDDEVVTPYTSAFLSGPRVTDITVQNQCSLDASDHLELSYDPVALADMLNALDPAHPVPVPCVPVLPLTGPVGPVPPF
ncbi:MAG TPA: alpha/beta fold hydrolase [Streptosporangiaceae bacterium]|jgi:triacylglycerol esterase/lipase EstA (alpha/beta hydrolase family)